MSYTKSIETLKVFVLGIFLFGSSISYSQKEDYNWAYGTYTEVFDNEIWGLGYFVFTDEGLMLKKSNNYTVFNITASAISTKEGVPLYYSNGMEIVDSMCGIIENGDSINYNKYWELWRPSSSTGPISFGLKLPQGMMMLPYPGYKDSITWLAANRILASATYTSGFFQGIISIKDNKVIEKKMVRSQDSLNYNIQACRHANGRDWWIVSPGINHKKYFTYLLSPRGFEFHHVDSFFTKYPSSNGQTFFSPQGDKYVVAEQEGLQVAKGHLSIFDFDRSTGRLTNLRYKPHVMKALFSGGSFSPDGSKFYFCNYEDLFQIDMTKENPLDHMKLVVKSDLYPSVYPSGFSPENGFVFLHLAPDGKLYGPGGNTYHSHIIEYPDEEGSACNVKQHALRTVSNGMSLPNFPNFRLGPLDGSPADTLGLDNHPIAKFRYEADTLDHLRVRFTDLSYFRPEKWTWDFGDGTTFDGKKPYWHTFPKNGVYNVCLTVSNENSSNTSCREVTIGTSSFTNDDLRFSKVVSVFPNPTDGPLLVTLSEYIPEKGNFILYDLMGREVMKSRVYYGLNSLDLSGLSGGTYVYKVFDGTKSIGSGKIVRI